MNKKKKQISIEDIVNEELNSLSFPINLASKITLTKRIIYNIVRRCLQRYFKTLNEQKMDSSWELEEPEPMEETPTGKRTYGFFNHPEKPEPMEETPAGKRTYGFFNHPEKPEHMEETQTEERTYGFFNHPEKPKHKEEILSAKKEWLILGFPSSINSYTEDIKVDEEILRSAILFWIGDERQYTSLLSSIAQNKSDDDLFGQYSLYAFQFHNNGILYPGAKEVDRYMIAQNIISSCKRNALELKAVYLGRIPFTMAEEKKFFSLSR